MKVRLAGAILLLASLTGCSTLADTFFTPGVSESLIGQRGPNVMGGVRRDVAHFNDSGCKGMLMVLYYVDLPFSFCFDVAFLPFTGIYALLREDPAPHGQPPPTERLSSEK